MEGTHRRPVNQHARIDGVVRQRNIGRAAVAEVSRDVSDRPDALDVARVEPVGLERCRWKCIRRILVCHLEAVSFCFRCSLFLFYVFVCVRDYVYF